MAQVFQQITRDHSASLMQSWFWCEDKLKSNFTLNLIKLSQRQTDTQLGKGNTHISSNMKEREESVCYFFFFLMPFPFSMNTLVFIDEKTRIGAYCLSFLCLCYQAMELSLFNVCLSSHLHIWNSEATTKQIKWWPLLRVSYPPDLW